MINLDKKTAALILIDLQKGITARPLVPRSGEAVIEAGRNLAQQFRAAHALTILVRVGWADDYADAPQQLVDQPTPRPVGGLGADWSEFAGGLELLGDIHITKRQWGAFYGTELDLQLRRRNIKTIVLGGIATNFGVESTAREAWERGYELIIAEDATATTSVELQTLAIHHIFPRIARVVKSAEIKFSE